MALEQKISPLKSTLKVQLVGRYNSTSATSCCWLAQTRWPNFSLYIWCVSPGCRQKAIDFIFLFDGSRSMTDGEFHETKGIIMEIMNNLTNTSVKVGTMMKWVLIWLKEIKYYMSYQLSTIPFDFFSQFAAVQFSTISRVVFNFNDFTKGSALSKLLEEPHMQGLTNTYKALNFVL